MAEIVVTIPQTRKVRATPNPQSADRGKTVTWQIPSASGEIRIVFKEVQLPNGSKRAIEPGESPIPGPLSVNGGTIRLEVLPGAPEGLYLYDIHDQGGKLEWLNPLGPGRNFGGLRIPPPPPGGG